ncbi:hypothetical protein [Neoroseomonas lacus]|uniref:Uncharacterized protein n=1 Tax=Neoroseomonas lacus TaxID=287609 RepID=A0A917L0E4_9PROT|nr:hypothetical protein [Neoroseomonas lacus]GGJ35518.1 hypothetical protein GCM10011320_49090 [Neoroseomonas lacus]
MPKLAGLMDGAEPDVRDFMAIPQGSRASLAVGVGNHRSGCFVAACDATLMPFRGCGVCMLTTLLAQIGVSAAAALTVAWAAVKFLGKSWVEHHFKQELEELKLGHNKQIERLKLDLDILRSRISKLHDQEFTVLPEVWSKMAAALSTMIAASDPQRPYANTIGMNDGELNEYLETTRLLAWEKGEIRNFPRDEQKGREAKLHNMLDWANYSKARQLAEEFRSFLQSRRIFMSDELTRELDRCSEMLDRAVAEFRRFLEARQANQPIELVICPTLKEESTRMMEAVRLEIQRKLFGDRPT